MECGLFCEAFGSVNWLWFTVAAVVVFAVGVLWHSLFFAKSWARVFKVEMPENAKPSDFIFTFLMQFIASALFGLALMMIVKLSLWLAVLTLVAFCGWEKGGLKFQFPDWSEFILAAMIRAGYTFVSGAIFILFGLI